MSIHPQIQPIDSAFSPNNKLVHYPKCWFASIILMIPNFNYALLPCVSILPVSSAIYLPPVFGALQNVTGLSGGAPSRDDQSPPTGIVCRKK